jgi:hypothetical protein
MIHGSHVQDIYLLSRFKIYCWQHRFAPLTIQLQTWHKHKLWLAYRSFILKYYVHLQIMCTREGWSLIFTVMLGMLVIQFIIQKTLICSHSVATKLCILLCDNLRILFLWHVWLVAAAEQNRRLLQLNKVQPSLHILFFIELFLPIY